MNSFTEKFYAFPSNTYYSYDAYYLKRNIPEMSDWDIMGGPQHCKPTAKLRTCCSYGFDYMEARLNCNTQSASADNSSYPNVHKLVYRMYVSMPNSTAGDTSSVICQLYRDAS